MHSWILWARQLQMTLCPLTASGCTALLTIQKIQKDIFRPLSALHWARISSTHPNTLSTPNGNVTTTSSSDKAGMGVRMNILTINSMSPLKALFRVTVRSNLLTQLVFNPLFIIRAECQKSSRGHRVRSI